MAASTLARGMSVLVFVPAWNEEETIGEVLRGVQVALPEADVLLVDDGSRDRTSQIARDLGIQVLCHPWNLGVGAAHQTAYLWALRGGYSYVLQLDGDGQHSPKALPRLLRSLQNNDLAVGSRKDSKYVVPLSRRCGQGVLRKILFWSTGTEIHDTTSGMRALGPEALCLFAREYSSDFAEVESLQAALLRGLRVEEVPVEMQKRQGGRSFLTPSRSVFYMFKTLLVLLLRRRKNFC